MMRKRTSVTCLGLAAAVAAILAGGPIASACSLILWNSNDKAVVAGRTMDLFIDDEPRLVFLPRGIARAGVPSGKAVQWTSKYASAVITAFDQGTSDGLNEAGLSAHLLYLHDSEYEPEDARPGLLNLLWPQYVLDNFATVADALAALKDVRIVSGKVLGQDWPLHLALSDATGDSAVIEFVDGKAVVHHGKHVTVMTNEPPLDEQLANLKRYKLFGGDLPMPGDIDPMSRFVRASSYLKTLPPPDDEEEAIGHLAGVVRNVAVPFGAQDTSGGDSTDAWPTRWASIADHTNKVYYVLPVNSPNVFWVDFSQLKPDGTDILAVTLTEAGLSGDVSARLKPFGTIATAFPPTR
ncbi:linear amide C-N hydrolase [Aquabacter sp. P-9]|uniref:linear amide C-N hydrolase n=1 Tax=Aquabacter sediminis TaxID=3029197 RepID=UPI00237EBEF9|nr:linear amide C-N hydrolase [Aquabacter sp. P-9]MDE1570795.1 linear amide C-N hydrolase [Aquabacter sp. P-9]